MIGRILLHLLMDPPAETLRAFPAEKLAVDLQQIGPPVGPVDEVAFGANQFIDQFIALSSRLSIIGEEGPDFFGCRW